MKRIVYILLAACLLLTALCACGGSTDYTLFAYDYDGSVIAAGDNMTSVLTLKNNGTGEMSINGERGRISSWSVEDGVFTVRSGSDTLYGTMQDGIIALDPGDGNRMYYAAEGADTSSLQVMSLEDYMLQSLHRDGSD